MPTGAIPMGMVWVCSRRGSNSHDWLRRPMPYPLGHGNASRLYYTQFIAVDGQGSEDQACPFDGTGEGINAQLVKHFVRATGGTFTRAHCYTERESIPGI